MTTPLTAEDLGIAPGAVVGVRVRSACCLECSYDVPVEVQGPWHGTLDDQLAAAQAAATAQHPDHGAVVAIIDPCTDPARDGTCYCGLPKGGGS